MLNSMQALLKEWEERSDNGIRLGQYFLNEYLPGYSWPLLYYNEDTDKSIHIIQRWLLDHRYVSDLPLKRRLRNEKV